MTNPFQSIHELTDAGRGHARQLAAAFLAVQFDANPNAGEENYRQLAVALRAVAHLSGEAQVLFRYLSSVHFAPFQSTESTQLEGANIGDLQMLAREYEAWAREQ